MPERLLIVSPVRNESAHIERVIAGMAAQERPPDLWIVVDDGSTDATADLLRARARDLSFMRVITAPAAPFAGRRDRLAAAAAPRAFNAGLRHSDWRTFSHIGKLDGDVELPPGYYREMLAAFAADAGLGICCADLVELRGGREHRLTIPPHHVHGALKLYSRECFDAIGGLHERLGWDTIDETYARLRGFRTRSFPEPAAVHHRPAGSADGTLRGRARHGECAYIAHFTLPWVAARSLKVSRNPPCVISGAAFLYGYLRASARRTPRVPDPEFRRYARWELRQRTKRALGLRAAATAASSRRAGA